MTSYHDIRELKKTEIRKGQEVTVIVWAPGDGRPPFVHTVVISGASRDWSEDDPNRPCYGAINDLNRDIERAFEAGFAYAETLIQ